MTHQVAERDDGSGPGEAQPGQPVVVDQASHDHSRQAEVRRRQGELLHHGTRLEEGKTTSPLPVFRGQAVGEKRRDHQARRFPGDGGVDP